MRGRVSSRDVSAGFPPAVGGDWTRHSGVGSLAAVLAFSDCLSARLAGKQH